MKDFVEGVHYYLENGKVIFTEKYHMLRGYCCGKKCRHCPYEPLYKRGSKKITENKKDTDTV